MHKIIKGLKEAITRTKMLPEEKPLGPQVRPLSEVPSLSQVVLDHFRKK